MKNAVSKGQFKAKALEYFREVERTGEPVIVTDHGRPVVEIRPYRGIEKDPLTILKGSILKYRDPTLPVADNDWEAISG
jgi:prevent-host-death family protein